MSAVSDKDVTEAYKVYAAAVGLDRGTSGKLRAICASGLRAVIEDWVRKRGAGERS